MPPCVGLTQEEIVNEFGTTIIIMVLVVSLIYMVYKYYTTFGNKER